MTTPVIRSPRSTSQNTRHAAQLRLRLDGFSSVLGTKYELVRRPGGDLVGDALVAKPEMAGRLIKRRVDDRVLDDNLAHTGTPPTLPVRTLTEQSGPLVTAAASVQRVMARIVGAPRRWTLNSIGVADSHWGFSYFSSSVSRASSPSA